MFVFASSRSLVAESQTPWNKLNYKHFQTTTKSLNCFQNSPWQHRWCSWSPQQTRLSPKPPEKGKVVIWSTFTFPCCQKILFHLLYVSEHHLLTGRLNLLDQTDQKTSSTLRPPVCHVMSLIPCHRTMTSGKNMHMFLSKSLYVVFATGLLHYRCSYPVTCRPDICHFFSTNVLLGSIFLHMKARKLWQKIA